MKKSKSIRKALCILLVMMTLLSCMAPAASALSNNIHDILFDWEYYVNKYDDLAKVIGRNPDALRVHWDTCGKREGRSPSALYDPHFYLNTYPDLKAAFGDNYAAAYNHLVNHGIAEGRQSSPTFSVTTYKNNYDDLRRAFGTSSGDNWKYLKHWREYGCREQRNAVTRIGTAAPTPTPSNNTNNNNNTSGTVAYVKTSGANLNLRAKASTSSSVLAKLANGTKVTVLQYTGDWAKVSVNGKTGYVSKQYLSQSSPNGNNSPTVVVSSGAFDYPMNNTYVCGNNWGTYYSKRPDRPYHCGIDIASRNGDRTVMAAADGTIVKAGYNSANGNFVIIQHTLSGKTVYSFYAHLASITRSSGAVSKGTAIGVMGNTGSASAGAHLHFAIVSAKSNTGGYYGYIPSVGTNSAAFSGVTYYNPHYVVANDKLP